MVNIYLGGLLWVLGAATVAALITVLVHKKSSTSAKDRADNNTAAGNIFTIVGGLHAVLLAFVLISLFDAVNTARADAYREANSLVAVSWAAESLEEPARTRIQELTAAYSTTVSDQEWPQMRADEPVDSAGWQQLEQLRTAIDEATTAPDDAWQESRKAAASEQLWEVYQARQGRLDDAANSGVNAVVWFALVLGSVMSMSLVYLLGGPKLVPHALLAAILAAGITLLLYAVYQMQNPFSGGASVGPEAFRLALDRLR